MKSFKIGLPQGIVLAHFLCSLYMYVLPNSILRKISYADDMIIKNKEQYISSKAIQLTSIKLRLPGFNLLRHLWCRLNRQRRLNTSHQHLDIPLYTQIVFEN